MFKIKRIYEKPSADDGYRVLIDRLWPRGMSKEKAKLDRWYKEIAPSTELRKWFGHKAERWETFQNRYLRELKENRGAVEELKALQQKHRTVTLLYAAQDSEHNQARVLLAFLLNNSPKQ